LNRKPTPASRKIYPAKSDRDRLTWAVTKGGRVVHDYADHASILKFIERNWHLPTITGRSRDNLPNPVATEGNPYVPANSPAIDDLFGMFQFERGSDGDFDKDGKKG
jgi:phospholipase C